METFNDILSYLNGFLWGWPMIILLFGTHLFLTFRLRFPQRHIFKAIKLSVSKDGEAKGDISQFGSLATALAATIGTGNIVGVGTAIALGGPGAVFWCWLTGFFGIATKYSEGLLAIKYRETAADGKSKGGPMYAIENGLAKNAKSPLVRSFWKILAVSFAFFTAVATLGIGSTVQANAISTISYEAYGASPVVLGGVICILAASVIMGGVKSISKVCQMLVPFMAGFYVLGCLVILVINAEYLLPAVKLIIVSAFNPQAAGAGFVGFTIMKATRFGIARGLFSNESGLGSAPIIAAAAQTKNPVRQALVSSSATFWDTVVICAITGIVIVSSIVASPEIDFSNGGTLTKMAFSRIPYIGAPVLTICSITFAFSTILGWSYYGERGIEYLGDRRLFSRINTSHIVNAYRIIFLLSVYFGAVVSLDVVWNMADFFNALMAIPNLLCLLFLSGVTVHETKKYLWSGRLDEEM